MIPSCGRKASASWQSWVVRGASGTNTCDSRVFCTGRQQRQCSNAQSRCLCAEADATPSQTTARSRLAQREPLGKEAGYDDNAGGGSSVDERGRDGLNSPRRIILICQTSTENREEHLFFGTGEKGNRQEGNGNHSAFERAVTEWAKALRLRRTAAAGRHMKTRDRRGHHHESCGHSILFLPGLLMR